MLDQCSLPSIVSLIPLNGTPITDPDFLEGVDIGRELALGDAERGQSLRNETDLWDFVSGECSPEHVARERQVDEDHGYSTPTVPFTMRLGTLAGYMVTTITLLTQVREPLQ